jgi:uncharacterized protein (TIGR02099 family)
MIRILHFSARTLKWLLLLGIMLLGLLVGAGRLLAPLAADYRGEVERMASQVLEQPVSIGSLQGTWSGLGPELVLNDLQLLDPESGKPRFRLSEVRIAIALVDSLRQGVLAPRRITLINPLLHIVRQQDGRIAIGGADATAREAGDGGGVFLLPNHIRVKNGNVIWEDHVTLAAPLQLSGVNLDIRNDGERHQLNGHMKLTGKPDGDLSLQVDLRGDPDRSGTWSANMHLKSSNLDLARLLNRRFGDDYQVTRGRSELEFWGNWKQSRLAWMQGRVDWTALELSKSGQGDTPGLMIDQLGGHFRWQRIEGGGRFDINRITLSRNGVSWPETEIGLEYRRDEAGQLGLVAAGNHANLADLADMTALLPSSGVHETLTELRPTGNLKDFQLALTLGGERPLWRIHGKIDALESQPWGDIPGIAGLPLKFQADQDQGSIDLDSGPTSVGFTELFRDPILLNRLQGRVYWQRLASGWQISTKELSAENDDIHTKTRLLLTIPDSEEESVFMDLQTDYRDGDGSTTSRYLPVSIMPKDVVSWVDRSIVSGQVVDGSVLVRGPLRDFPFEKTPSGRFEVFFRTDDLVLDYWPEWPRLEKLKARVRFLGNRLDVWVEDGQIYDSRLAGAHGRIRELSLTSPFELDGMVEGPFGDTLRLLTESPLKEDFGKMVSGIKGAGDSRLALDFAIPIDDDSPFRLDGKLTFRDSSLQMEEWQLDLSNIHGDLLFDQDRIHGQGIRGQAQGNDILVDVSTPADNPKATRIGARGAIPGAHLRERFPDIALLEQVEGTGDWSLQLDIPHLAAGPDAAVPVQVTSTLEGVQVDLPAPLGKTAAQPGQFLLETDFSANRALRPLRLRYGSLLDVSLLLDERQEGGTVLTHGDIRIGGASSNIPARPGLTIQGELPELNLDPWLDLAPQAGEKATLPEIRQLTLNVERLGVRKQLLKGVSFNLESLAPVMVFELSSDKLNGRISIPDDLKQHPVRLSLKRLDLELDMADDTEAAEAEGSAGQHDPTSLPAIEAEVEQVRINGKDFGPLQLISRRIDGGLELQKLTMNSKKLKLSASGRWILTGEQSQISELDLSMQSANFGELLGDLGFTRNIEEAPTEIDSRLQWPGGLLDFDRKRINGQVRMQIGQGRFLSVDPGVGRIFGLLNISALQRRLTLDFSDIFKKGFSFDSIEGNFLLDEGDAYTNDLVMNGPSAKIEIAGRTGFADEDFDQLVTITPKLSSTLPLAGSLAGGPAVGAVLFLAQKLVGEKFDRVTQIQYFVTGPWDDPVLTPKRDGQTDDQENPLDIDLLEHPQRDDAGHWQLPQAHGKQQFSLSGKSTPTWEPEEIRQFDTVAEADEPKQEKPGFFSRLFSGLKPAGNPSPQPETGIIVGQ